MNRTSAHMVAESIEIKAKCITEAFPTISSNISKSMSLMLTYTKFISENQLEVCKTFIRFPEINPTDHSLDQNGFFRDD
jgi:hypothetical protein